MKKRLYAVIGLLPAAWIPAGCSAKYPEPAGLQGKWVDSGGGSHAGCSLCVVYASGEVLSVSDDGSGPERVFGLPALPDCAEKQDPRVE